MAAYSLLFLGGYVEEGFALRYHLLEELVGYPHVLQIEEADFHESMPEFGQECGLGC